ncbi:MAG: DUF488 family protein [Hormoscilla sp. GM102CHS1]|nr:DUF488 family protein [Hormoscilla sp. GM102CHS1]
MNDIYTIGYNYYTVQGLISRLREYSIRIVADIRSVPYNKYRPEFDRDTLCLIPRDKGIGYVFLGDKLGIDLEIQIAI